jgi:TolB-like protein/Flp pilus assembly protein TadD
MKDVLLDVKELRDELALEAKLERSIRPASNSENQPTLIAEGEVTQEAGRQTQAAARPPTASSAEYLVSEIRQHKRGLAIVLLVLLIVVGGLGYWYFSNRAPNAKQIESIAVMPFVNESGNSEVEYLSDGMTETLIKSLSQLPNLAVKSRSTVFYYKGKETSPKKIGEELNVQAVLLGRVGGRGDELKLSLELVNTNTQDVIWSEQYNRKQSALVTLQSEIAKDVSSKLKTKLSGAEEAKVTNPSTVSPEAYQAYLKGRYYWNRRTAENIRKAIEQFKSATDRDSNYALAYVGLADCYVVLNYYAGTPTSETVPQAKAFAERAIAIDDQLAEPHASLGQVNKLSWQWAEAEREFKRAIELNPNYATAYHWYSLLLRALGRIDEGDLMIRRAQERDPLSSVIGNNISLMYVFQNDFNACIETALKYIELDPNYPDAYSVLGLAYLKQGRNAEAIANMEKAVELSNRASFTLVNLGYGYGVSGKRSEAIAIVKEMEEKYARKESSGRYVASVYAGLGDKDKAFEWLEKDYQTKGDLTWIRWEVPYETLRDDPRFKDLLKRMNLPE